MNTLNLFSTALLSTFFIVGCTGDGRLAYKGPGSCAPNANSVVLDSATYSISNSKSSKKDVYQFQQRITGTRESSLKRDQSNKNNRTSENKNTTNKFKTKDYKYIVDLSAENISNIREKFNKKSEHISNISGSFTLLNGDEKVSSYTLILDTDEGDGSKSFIVLPSKKDNLEIKSELATQANGKVCSTEYSRQTLFLLEDAELIEVQTTTKQRVMLK